MKAAQVLKTVLYLLDTYCLAWNHLEWKGLKWLVTNQQQMEDTMTVLVLPASLKEFVDPGYHSCI